MNENEIEEIRTAYHEAGHAVAMIALRIPVRQVSIWQLENGSWSGNVKSSHSLGTIIKCLLAKCSGRLRASLAMDQAISCLASVAAVVESGIDDDTPGAGAASDFVSALEWSRIADVPIEFSSSFLDTAYGRARELMSSNREALRNLANALIATHSVTGVAAKRIVRAGNQAR